MIRVTDTISLHEHEIEEQFIRAPGPGGQNVNKVASAVQLRFDAASCPALAESVFVRLRSLAGSRMTQQGVIVLTANRFRSQDRNRQDALERLIALLRDAATPPKRRRPDEAFRCVPRADVGAQEASIRIEEAAQKVKPRRRLNGELLQHSKRG